MLNQAEFLQLKNPNLSHVARTLYVFYLKPEVLKGHNQIDLRTLTTQLVSFSEVFPEDPNSDQIGMALDELEQLKLITYLGPGQVLTYDKECQIPLDSKVAAKIQQVLRQEQGGQANFGQQDPQAPRPVAGNYQGPNQGNNCGYVNPNFAPPQDSPYVNPYWQGQQGVQVPQGSLGLQGTQGRQGTTAPFSSSAQQAYQGAGQNIGNSQAPIQEACYPIAPNGQVSCAFAYPQPNQGYEAPATRNNSTYPSAPHGAFNQGQGYVPQGQGQIFPMSNPMPNTQSIPQEPQGYGPKIAQNAGGNKSIFGLTDKSLKVEYENKVKKDPWRWQGALIALPLFTKASTEHASTPFRMFADWQPSATLAQAAYRAGVVDYSFDARTLQEFISYWLTRGDERTQFGWERAFIQRLIRLNQISDIKERALHTPDYKRSRKHEFQTLKSIFTGVREYSTQPKLESLTKNLVNDKQHSGLKTQLARGGSNLHKSLGVQNGGDPTLLPSLAQAAGIELEDDDIMIIPGYTLPEQPSPYANGGYITPPSEHTTTGVARRLSPKDLVEQLSAYSAQEVEDILYKLAKNRKFASVFDTGLGKTPVPVEPQGDPDKTIPLTPISKLNPYLVHPLTPESMDEDKLSVHQGAFPEAEQEQGQMTSQGSCKSKDSNIKAQSSGKKKRQDNSYVPVDINKLKPYL